MKPTSLFVLAMAAMTFSPAHAAAPKKFADLGKIKPITVTAAKPGEAVVTLVVIKGFHIQANPASNPALIATTLTVNQADGLAAGMPEYPAGKAYHSATTDVMAYEGKVEIKLPVAIGTATAGKHEIVGKLRYQACNDETCFFPINADVKIPVMVE